jgi:hypothetical protein
MSDVPNRVIIDQDVPNRVLIQTGTAGANTRRHIHTQSSVSSEWTVTHSLGGKPQVTVVDSSDTCVFGEVIYISNSQLKVLFSAPFSGFAYLT